MKLGVLGGTFDPIHLGHLQLAHRTQKHFALAQVHFVVTAVPPHKSAEELIPFNHRYAMVSLATSGATVFVPSLIELDPPASPYSIHTLRKQASRYRKGQANIYFIAGGDSLLEVGGWRESGELLSSYNFVFVVRPGFDVSNAGAILPRGAIARVRDFRGLGPRQLRRNIQTEEKTFEKRIFIIDVGALDISSTQIRSLVAAGTRIHHLVPPPVYEYIQKLRLYGD
ncbi:MAG: nicotinate-nucleotide adenylyltransferase [Nitrososphaera sp.]